jgi:redox-sensing transcriptional repressor
MYPGFLESGFQIVAIFDADPDKVGTQINSLTIEALRDLETVVKARAASIGIIATPAAAAQEVADRFIGAGIRSILNFAPAVLKKPAGIEVRRVDLSTELQILAFHQNQEAG